MVAHSKGNRTRSRNLLKKSPRERGAIPSLGSLMYDYKPGEKVVIKINPSIHHGMPHRRYHGKVAEIVAKRGRAYEVKLKLGEKQKSLLIRPEHMILFKSG
ncbi:50S ribosomal protein L21 [Candidatus Acidianus copahuensis]|uniref:Large ribosomal subunit protein eL21 n=1 Tax=Candidatus Acidianus copahuensis TaxID=1160895 RepID=A0A031LMI6_9CREN|nr:50S ribosomal protein L21e [Candidatus Acidianus copahuensis]EZQ03891.1 50S ribosomal protein L21 [Candidatus Acidianus copahuensis]